MIETGDEKLNALCWQDVGFAAGCLVLIWLMALFVDSQMKQQLDLEREDKASFFYHAEIMHQEPFFWIEFSRPGGDRLIDEIGADVKIAGFEPVSFREQFVSFGLATTTEGTIEIQFPEASQGLQRLGFFLSDVQQEGSVVHLKSGDAYVIEESTPGGRWIYLPVAEQERVSGRISVSVSPIGRIPVAISALALLPVKE